MTTTARTRLDNGTTFDTRAGALPAVTLPSFGTAAREIAAKVVKDYELIALIMAPRARWNQSYGGWSGDDEDRFRWAVRQIAAHLGGEVTFR